MARNLPQWLRTTRQRSPISCSGKLRLGLLAALCIALGWMVTSSLAPSESLNEFGSPLPGILEDPYEIGDHSAAEDGNGVIGDVQHEAGDAHEEDYSKPSVSGALSSLGQAVTSKIKSWNPYLVKPSHHSRPIANHTEADPDSKPRPKTHGPAKIAGEYIKDGMSDEDRLGARVRIGKVTILFRGTETWERCIRTHEEHDRYHGYRLHILRRELMDDVWTKPAYILSLLLRELAKPEDRRLEWLFWFDSDTIVLNPRVPIETFLPPQEFDDIHLVYSNDWNGLNNGVFPIRVNQWAVNLFAAIVSYRYYKPDVHLSFRDQSAMNNLMQEPMFAKNIMEAPQRWFNAYQGEHNQTLQPFQVRRGDLLVHFAGVSPREERMRYWLRRAEAHLDEWEMPLKSTSYPEETKEFWEQQRGIRREKARKLGQIREEAMKLLETTEHQLRDYGDRLTEDQRIGIQQEVQKLRDILEKGETKDDEAKITECIRFLSNSTGILTAAITEANKVLLNSAHKAIFASEKDLLEAGFHEGKTTPELDQISIAVSNLKGLIMIPEEKWDKSGIIAATNALTEARARQQGSVDSELAQKENKLEEEAAKAQTAKTADTQTSPVVW